MSRRDKGAKQNLLNFILFCKKTSDELLMGRKRKYWNMWRFSFGTQTQTFGTNKRNHNEKWRSQRKCQDRQLKRRNFWNIFGTKFFCSCVLEQNFKFLIVLKKKERKENSKIEKKNSYCFAWRDVHTLKHKTEMTPEPESFSTFFNI